jgi:hypothetical protein
MQITYSCLDPKFCQEPERKPLKRMTVNELIGAAALPAAQTAE